MNEMLKRSSICRYPFDWQNPTGYFIAFTLQYIALVYLVFFTVCSGTIGIASYMFVSTMIGDIKNNYQVMNECVKSKENHSDLSYQFHGTLQFHSTTKELSEMVLPSVIGFCLMIFFSPFFCRLARDLSKLVQPIFMAIISSAVITICVALLIIQKEMVKFIWIRIVCFSSNGLLFFTVIQI